MVTFIRACLLISVTASLASVFLSGVFLGLALLAWLYQSFSSRRLQLEWPGYFPVVIVFVLAALLSIVLSEAPLESIRYIRKFVHLFAIVLVFTWFDRRWVRLTIKVVFAIAGLSAIVGIVQYFILNKVELLDRTTGLMSHWMTFAGQMMIVSVVLAAWLCSFYFRGTKAGEEAQARFGLHWFWAAVLPLTVLALVLSMTRSAWVGLMLGMMLVATVRNYRLAIAATVPLIVLIWLFLPARFHERLMSSFDPQDTTNRVRAELWTTGINIIKSHPYTGIGPRMVPRTFERYRNSHEFPDWAYQHLHNNLIQIAAEMGILGLVTWLGIWVKLAWDQASFLRIVCFSPRRLAPWQRWRHFWRRVCSNITSATRRLCLFFYSL